MAERFMDALAKVGVNVPWAASGIIMILLFKGCRPVPPTPNIVVDMTRGGLAMKLEAAMFVDSGVLEGCPVQRTHF